MISLESRSRNISRIAVWGLMTRREVGRRGRGVPAASPTGANSGPNSLTTPPKHPPSMRASTGSFFDFRLLTDLSSSPQYDGDWLWSWYFSWCRVQLRNVVFPFLLLSFPSRPLLWSCVCSPLLLKGMSLAHVRHPVPYHLTESFVYQPLPGCLESLAHLSEENATPVQSFARNCL